MFDNIAADPRTPSIPQLEFFAAARYDAIIFGNHDFDRYESALFTMLQKAESLHLDLTILTSNLLPLPDGSKFLQFQSDNSHVKFKRYIIKESRDGRRVGVVGYITPDALFVSSDYRDHLQFVGMGPDGQDYAAVVELADRQSTQLKEELGCDVVVVIIHGGRKDFEDAGMLALANVDVVMGGHTHESYLHTEGGAISGQCGYSGMLLSALRIGYSNHVYWRGPLLDGTAEPPHCIPVSAETAVEDGEFRGKVEHWHSEIQDLLSIQSDRVVFRGNLMKLFNPSWSRQDMSTEFATMLLQQYNKRKSPDEQAMLFLWNKEFLKTDFLTHHPEDVILTHGDAYNLIFFSGTKDTYTFYMNKHDVYKILQGTFLMTALVSPLITLTAGGLSYHQSWVGPVPIISNISTWDGIPYAEWPERVKVVANSISAPYFWKIDTMTRGVFSNFATDHHGNALSLEDARASDDPNEMELFLSYLSQNTQPL